MNMSIFWVIACILFILLELMTPTALICIWFAAGSLAAFVLAFLHMDIWVQIVLFFIVSLASMLVIRPMSTRYLRGKIVRTNADRLIGENAVVIEAITKERWGVVKVNGAKWSAVEIDGKQVEVNEEVKIIAIEGAKLLVRKQ